MGYDILVMAVNKKGKSGPVILQAFTVKGPEKQTSKFWGLSLFVNRDFLCYKKFMNQWILCSVQEKSALSELSSRLKRALVKNVCNILTLNFLELSFSQIFISFQKNRALTKLFSRLKKLLSNIFSSLSLNFLNLSFSQLF